MIKITIHNLSVGGHTYPWQSCDLKQARPMFSCLTRRSFLLDAACLLLSTLKRSLQQAPTSAEKAQPPAEKALLHFRSTLGGEKLSGQKKKTWEVIGQAWVFTALWNSKQIVHRRKKNCSCSLLVMAGVRYFVSGDHQDAESTCSQSGERTDSINTILDEPHGLRGVLITRFVRPNIVGFFLTSTRFWNKSGKKGN